jgi:major membrane immunogen (membrane-anchored lipoprotein)
MSHRFSLLVVMAAGCLLSGCFSSETPKFPLASAAAPFGDGGRYQAYERTDGDNFKKDEIITVKRRSDGGYDFINQKGEVQPISLHRVADNNFVGQAVPEKDKSRYAYVIFRFAGNEALIFLPDCEKQDQTRMGQLGVVFIGRYECSIDRVADPTAFFASLTLGEPTSKMVRE